MALRMDRPWKHPDTGVYYFRKWIPLPLRPLLGKTVEKRSLGTKDPQVAKGLHRQVAALVEAEWRQARKAAAAETAPATASLTHKQIQALAGEVYRRRVAAHEDEPGAIERWVLEADWDRFARSKRTLPIDAALARARWRPLVDEVLVEQRIVLDLPTHRRVMQATLDAVRDAHARLGRAAEGDYRPDPMADRFPKWEPLAPVAPTPALPFEECWQAYQTRARLAPKTVKRWSGTLRRMVAHAGTDDLARITREQLIAWKGSLLDEGLDPLSVRDAYLASAKALFSFLVSDGKLKENPAVGIKVIVPKKPKLRGPEFTDTEARTILSATLAPFSALISPEHAAARRWVPWLCAYLGARVNEMTQLRAEDVCEWHGTRTLSDGRSEPFSCWVVRITPEAGSVKTHEARLVPLHPHLVEQGFVEFATARRQGPLFYDPARGRGASAANPTYVRVGQKLAEWVRGLGINDPNVDPNHGWRHRLKTDGRRHRMRHDILDSIQGHSSGSVSDGYGSVPPDAMYMEIVKLPRFVVTAAETTDRRRKVLRKG